MFFLERVNKTTILFPFQKPNSEGRVSVQTRFEVQRLFNNQVYWERWKLD